MKLTYKDALALLDKVTDANGKKIDFGIRPLVAALHLNGIPTTSSCEGHLDRGCPYPWIDISSDVDVTKPEGEPDPMVTSIGDSLQRLAKDSGNVRLLSTTVVFEANDRRYYIGATPENIQYRPIVEKGDGLALKQANRRILSKFSDLLDSFYTHHHVRYENMLGIEAMGSFGAVRLQCIGSIAADLNEEANSEFLAAAQAEMNDFAEYLKNLH